MALSAVSAAGDRQWIKPRDTASRATCGRLTERHVTSPRSTGTARGAIYVHLPSNKIDSLLIKIKILYL